MVSYTRAILIGLLSIISLLGYHVYVPPMNDITSNPYQLSLYLMHSRVISSLTTIFDVISPGSSIPASRFLKNLIPANIQSDQNMTIVTSNLAGVPALIYIPINKEPKSPAVFYLHGGKFMYYTKWMYSSLVYRLAESMNCVVALIDYPLAPENPYPKGLDDSYKALLYFIEHAGDMDVDPQRIAIAGDSAGANLATSLAIKLHSDPKLPKLKLQILIYPKLQALEFDTPSYRQNANDYSSPRNDSIVSWYLYLFGKSALPQMDDLIKAALYKKHVHINKLKKVLPRVDYYNLLPQEMLVNHPLRTSSVSSLDVPTDIIDRFTDAVQDPLFSPVSGASDNQLRVIPPVYLVTCSRDILRDDALLFKKRMENANNRIFQHDTYDHLHSFLSFNRLPEADKAIKKIGDYFKRNAML